MPLVSSQKTAGYWEPGAYGPISQMFPDLPVPIVPTIAASGTWDSGLLLADGFKAMAIGLNVNQSCTLEVRRYIDAAGNVQQSLSSTALSAGTTVVNITDNLPFYTYRIRIVNGGAIVTISNFTVLLNAA